MMRSPDRAAPNPAPRRLRRRWAWLLLLPLLGWPAGFRAIGGPAVEPLRRPGFTVTPHFTDSTFVTEDGVHLPLRRWLPTAPVKAVILALHGFGDYSRAFEEPATLWAKLGIATYAYDQRGFGAAPGRGKWVGGGRLAVDAVVASRILRRAYPGRPLFLLGESMGGAVAILAATGAMHGVIPGPAGMPVADADGVILCAPAVWGRTVMDFLPKAALFAAVRFVPQAVLTGAGLHIWASDNIPMLRALSRDPLVQKGARVATVFGLVNLMDAALAAAPRLDMPTLLLYGAHDQIVPRRAIENFVAHLPLGLSARRRLAYYPHGYHLLLRDLDGAAVAGDVANWIFDPAVPLPSHADRDEAARPWPPAHPRAARPPAEAAPALPLAPPRGSG